MGQNNYLWVANNSDFELTTDEERTIRKCFDIPELTNNMRNTKNIAIAANQTPNPWDNYQDGLKPMTIPWNQGETVGQILQQAFEHLQNDFKNLLILPLKEDLNSCYHAANDAAKHANQENVVCLYGTSDQPDATTIPETSEGLIEKIVNKELTLVSSMTFVQGAEFKSVIAFLPEEKSTEKNPELTVSCKKVFLSNGNVLLRARINLVIVRVSR